MDFTPYFRNPPKSRPYPAGSVDHAEPDKKDQDRCWALLFLRAAFDDTFRAAILENDVAPPPGSPAGTARPRSDRQRRALEECGLNQGGHAGHGGIWVFETKAEAAAKNATPGFNGLCRYLPEILPAKTDVSGNPNAWYVLDFSSVRAFRQQYGMNTGAF